MGIRAKSNFDRSRTIWTPEMDRYFIDLMLEQLNKGNRFDDHVFSKTAWMNMNSSFNERNLYKAVKNLLNQKGFNWDSTRQMVIAENKIWDEYIKVNPDVRPYRVKTIPYYDDLGIIYGDNSARKKGNDASLILLGLKFGVFYSSLILNLGSLKEHSGYVGHCSCKCLRCFERESVGKWKGSQGIEAQV
ncbi:hypothetical protein V6Z12_D08G051800 [Gossypium hirsutum]